MRISRRPSGGRGEYEISEDVGAVTPRTLLDRRLLLRIGDHVFDTGTVLRLQGGKRRLRRAERKKGLMQVPRQVAAVLLMPMPVRAEEALGSGQPILKSERYAIEHIAIDDVDLVGDDGAILTAGEITLRNFNLHAEPLDTRERLEKVERLWAHADELPRDIRDLLRSHKALVTTGRPVLTNAAKAVADLQTVLTDAGGDFGIYRQGGEDVVDDLLHTLKVAAEPPPPPIGVDEVDPGEIEIKRRTVREWRRWAASRGAKSARFRQQVREAYGWTCAVCGAHYPRTRYNRIAGVDGAHILPWADYDIDEVSNGLSLCRLHHWAFDEGLLVIRWTGNAYVVEIPEAVKEGIKADCPDFDLEELERFEGGIPEARLPHDPRLRPNPRFLELLHQLLFENV